MLLEAYNNGVAEQARPLIRNAEGDLSNAGFELITRAPPPYLRDCLFDLCGYTEASAGTFRRWEYSGPRIVVILEIGPPIRVYAPGQTSRYSRYGGGFVAGLDERFSLTEHDGFQQGMQLNLTPIGARLLLGLPLSEITGHVVNFADLVPELRDLAWSLAELPDWRSRFDRVEAALGERIARARADASPGGGLMATAWALSEIERRRGRARIADLADELGYSQKHLIRLFQENAGVTPRLYSRIARFHRLLEYLRGGGQGPWAELAVRFGYYDQSHLIREVKHFTGNSPTRAHEMLGPRQL